MTTAAPTKTHIRWMIRRDMPDVLRAERDSFEFSWTEEDFLKCLRQRNCIGMVAEHNEKVVGFTHRSMDMGPGGAYHILSRGGVDRGGVTAHLPGGVAPHWLPYVAVDSCDDAATKAKSLGAKIFKGPFDAGEAGRMAVLVDPAGATFACAILDGRASPQAPSACFARLRPPEESLSCLVLTPPGRAVASRV